MPRKGFPQTVSMPSFTINDGAGPSRSTQETAMRSIESENLTKLPAVSSPYTKRSNGDFNKTSGRWPSISISSTDSSDEDEKHLKTEPLPQGKPHNN